MSKAQPPGTTKVALDLRTLPVPTHRVFANGCAVLDHGLVFEFAFTQARAKGPSRLAASLMMPIEAVANLWAQSGDFYKLEGSKLHEAGIPVQELGSTAPEWGEAPVVYCNIFRASRSGTEAVMECYWLSPWWVVQAIAGKKVVVEPVITIHLPFPLLMGLLEHSSKVMAEVKKRVGSLMPFREPSE